MYNLTYTSQASREIIHFINTEYSSVPSNDLPPLPTKQPLSGRGEPTQPQPAKAFSFKIPELQAVESYFRQRPEEVRVIMGLYWRYYRTIVAA
jgi:hypothetical protein